MDNYATVAYKASQSMTNQYSSSFGMATRLFPREIRPHIYALYGLVRLADEIVDTHQLENAGKHLDQLEQTVFEALQDKYSSNLIVHAFAKTADTFSIGKDLIQPFFDSMRADINPKPALSESAYTTYIYGSAEVVGLMCLKVFCPKDKDYQRMAPGARALGSAFQKINFLRDMAADYKELGRYYFPNATFETFDNTHKMSIVREISQELQTARRYILALPPSVGKPVGAAYNCYAVLLSKLALTPADMLKQRRVRITTVEKLKQIQLAKLGRYKRLP